MSPMSVSQMADKLSVMLVEGSILYQLIFGICKAPLMRKPTIPTNDNSVLSLPTVWNIHNVIESLEGLCACLDAASSEDEAIGIQHKIVMGFGALYQIVEKALSAPPDSCNQVSELKFPYRKRKMIFHFIRHAQATHNIPHENRWNITDPPLTLLGRDQARDFSKSFRHLENICTIYCSPMRRTLQTSLIGFGPRLRVKRTNLKIKALPPLRETGTGLSSTGSSLEQIRCTLQKEGKGHMVDLSRVEEGWEVPKKDGESRTQRVVHSLYNLKVRYVEKGILGAKETESWTFGDVEIAIVSHGSFLNILTKNAAGNFRNMECRSFEFADPEFIESNGCSKYELSETQESQERRRRSMPTRSPIPAMACVPN